MHRAVAVVRSATAMGLTGAAKVLRTGADAFSGLAGIVRRTPAEPAEAAQRGAEEGKDAAKRTVRKARDTVQGAADTAADVTERAADTAAGAVEQVAEGTADAVERAAEGTAEAVERAAGAEEGDEAGGTGRVSAEDVARTFGERGSVQAPEATDVPEVSHAAAPPSHVAELARGSVAQVVEAIEGLSTDELRQLLEHEQANKRRKGVLDAVEQALTP